MNQSPQKSKRKRVYGNRKKLDKICEYSKKEGLIFGALIDEALQDLIEKKNL